MRLVILTALIFGLGVLLLFGFLRLARELLLKEFFPPPSMPPAHPTGPPSAL
jgi:hypothetical protein